MSVVLDASAVLAFLHNERGGENVSSALEGGCISAVNWSEVVQKSVQRQVDVEGMWQDFMDVGMRIEPFTVQQAEYAARIWLLTRQQGLSMADRACLALAIDKTLPVLTADRAWTTLDLGLEIGLIR